MRATSTKRRSCTDWRLWPCTLNRAVVTLWDLLVVLGPAVGLGGAIAGARTAHAGAFGWVAAVAAGALVGLATVRLKRAAWTYGERLLAEPDRAATEWRFRILYGLAVVWVFSAGVVGFGITRGLLLMIGG